jgi:hypothetical protein
MAVLETEDARSLLWSPLSMDAALADSVAKVGEPFAALAPNAFHHLYLGGAKEHFKNAELWAAPGVAEKQPSLTLRTLEAPTGTPRAQELAPGILGFVMPGMPKINEVVLLHRPSRTLVLVDLIFNVHNYDSFMMGFVLGLFGTRKRFAESRLTKFMTKDRSAARAAKDEVLSWDFDRVIMAHGDVVESGGKDMVAKAWNGKA